MTTGNEPEAPALGPASGATDDHGRASGAGRANPYRLRLSSDTYSELKRLARDRLRGNRDRITLHATALVNAVYDRLGGEERSRWESRGHFLAGACTAMRQILVDHLRRRLALKRGGDRQRVPLPETGVRDATFEPGILDLDAALTTLATTHPRQARVVEYKFFVALRTAEIAAILGVSRSTVEEDWRQAREWLRRKLCSTVWSDL